MTRIKKTEQEWRKLLGQDKYHICREGGTEPAFTGMYWDCKTRGDYHCSACHQKIFSSEAKYDSGSGWPSFFEPLDEKSIILKPDNSLNMQRIEVLCGACESHLGHLFEDGPEPTGLRYCVNSASLDLAVTDESDNNTEKQQSSASDNCQ